MNQVGIEERSWIVRAFSYASAFQALQEKKATNAPITPK